MRSRLRNLRSLVVVTELGAIALSACFIGPLDDLVGAASTDAGGDALVAAGDAGADAIAISDGGPLTTDFCASIVPAPLFCDDFDQSIAFSSHWTASFNPNGATISVAEDAGVSPPNALHATDRHDTADGSAPSFKRFDQLTGSYLYTRFSFDMRVDAPDAATAKSVRVNRFEAAGMDLSFNVDSGKLSIVASTDSPDDTAVHHAPLVDFTFGKWTHVDTVVDARVNPVTVSVSVDGKAVYSDTFPRALDDGYAVVAGIYSTPAFDGPWSVYVDNVVATQP